jgi:hypothetical protein
MEVSMLRAVSRVVLIVGSAALGAAGAIAWRSDLLVGYGLGRALEAQQAAAEPFQLAAAADAAETAEVGDEGYWLTRSSLEGLASFDRHLAVGHRITIAGGEGPPRTLEVVEITPLGSPLLKVAQSGTAVRLVRVTARVVGAAGPGREEPVRFYVELDKPKPAAPLSTSSTSQSPLGGT